MAFIYKLEHQDGTPADPPTFRSSPGTSWNAGDTIPLGSNKLYGFSTSALMRIWTVTLYRCWS